MTATLRQADRWANQPAGFNRRAADAVFKSMMALPDDETAAIYGRILVEALLQHDLVTKGAEITKAFNEQVAARSVLLRKSLARTAVSKAKSGEDSSAEIAGLSVLIKAVEFTEEERSKFARQQQRDLHSGRFVREHVKIGFDSTTKPLDSKHAAQFGIQPSPHLKGEDLARYQQAYGQLHEMLAPFTGMGHAALAHLHIHDANGPVKTVEMAVPDRGEPNALNTHLAPGQHLHSASVSVVAPTTAAGAAFDAVNALGMPTAAGAAYNTVAHGAGNTDRLHEFRTAQQVQAEQDDFVPSQRVFRSIGNSSKLLQDSLGDTAPRKLKFAMAVGEHVGRYGPEAQKVIGPTADKAAYRYRGTEAPIDPALANALTSIKRDPRLQGADKREYLLHGRGAGQDWTPSGVLEFFRRKLPAANLNTLHLKSGVVPPSTGIVINAKGETTAEAVGYGDDHYLPFNLKGKSFRSLKGGEYIRTRTFGGPTTEDIYTGLMSGAKGLTVVSHNGVYTVDFKNDLKGGRRFNDSAARMVGRYGHLLDAVRSEQVVTGGIHPSRLEEIATRADAIAPREINEDAYKAEFNRRLTDERRNPQLSHDQKTEATLDYFNGLALDAGTETGEINPDSLVNAYVNAEGARQWAEQGKQIEAFNRHAPKDAQMSGESLDFFKAKARDELTDTDPVKVGQKVARALGKTNGLDAAMRKAEADNKAQLTPLSLNGEGYKIALDGLQEQFPHYIDRVEFHPWGSSAGPTDTGYVRPKHNRPAEALSGYFDRHVSRTGQGKVYADSTRWQNGRREVRPVDRKTESAGETVVPTQSASADGATTAALRVKADSDLFAAFTKNTHLAPTIAAVTLPDGRALGADNALGGQRIADVKSVPELAQAAPNLMSLLDMTQDSFQKEYADRPEAMRAKLAGARDENARLKWLDVPSHVVDQFDRGGKPAPHKVMGEHPSTHLSTPNAEFDFAGAGPAFDAAMRPKASQIEATYAEDPHIKPLIARGDLPERIDDPSFQGKADGLLAALTQRRDAILSRAERDGIIPQPGDWAGIDRPSEGLLRARQLSRRHDSAVRTENEAIAASTGASPESVNTVEFRLPPKAEHQTDEEYASMVSSLMMSAAREQEADNKRSGFDNGRVLNG